MPLLYYSVMGEGRGHAARARAVVERLRGRCRVVLFTSHDALGFLRGEYEGDPGVEVREIPGLVFHYTHGKLDNGKTIREGLGFGAKMWSGVFTRRLEQVVRDERPDLVVTDFEPLLPRAARRCGVPVLSLDHQHFLSTYDLSPLPPLLRNWAWRMSWATWAFGIRQQRTVVSAFYKPPLRAGFEGITQVGPLLREAVARRTPARGDYLLCYFRRATPPRVIDLLVASGQPAKVYGLGEQAARGRVTFHPIDEQTFVDDLAGCDAVVAAAGNQLMGESLFFGKPVLALPERRHYEQRINAWFVENLGGGEQRLLEKVEGEDLAGFLQRREGYREHLAATRPCEDGCPEVLRVLDEMLTGSSKRLSTKPTETQEGR